MFEKTSDAKVVKKSLFKVVKIEEKAIIINLNGWRMRAYFEKDAEKEGISLGSFVELEHYGDADKPHKVEFLKIK